MKLSSILPIRKAVCLFCFIGFLNAQNATLNLWPNDIPNSKVNSDYQETDVFDNNVLTRASKVTVPTISVFFPDTETSNGSAVVICPGGGYGHLAMSKEGFTVAEWFNSLGVTAIVLKYRLPNDLIMKNKSIGPLQDVQEAIRTVRRNAKKWNLHPEKIGVIGFSAGGHLASTLSTHYAEEVYFHDSISAKPNFSILIYPVISMKPEITHQGSRKNLIGDEPSEDLVLHFSNEQQIDSLTPPTFLIHATDDKVVPVENSIEYYMGLKNNGVAAEMHIYEKGGHGFGLGAKDTSLFWTQPCEQWLRENQFLEKH